MNRENIDKALEGKLFRKSISAGILISLGGTAYLTLLSENRIFASLMFSLALLAICATGQNLFTGKVCKVKFSPLSIISVFVVLIGNNLGCILMGKVVSSINPELIETAREICAKKLYEASTDLFWKAVLCNILVFFAVEAYKKGCWIVTVLAAMAFVLCGFEHSIANMFYFSVGRCNGSDVTGYILQNVFFNAIGGIAINWLS